MAIGLNLYFSSQSICFVWAFGFPTVGGPMLGRPKYTSVSSCLNLFLIESLLYYLFECLLPFLNTLPIFSNPLSSFSSLIYSLRLVEGL